MDTSSAQETTSEQIWLSHDADGLRGYSPARLFRLVIGHRYMLILALLSGVAIALTYTELFASKTYRASATVMLESRKNTVTDLGPVLEDLRQDEAIINSEVEILRSRTMLFRVIDSLNLTQYPEFHNDPTKQGIVVRTLKQLLNPENNPIEYEPPKLRERALEKLTRRIHIEAIPGSLVFRVAVHTENPKLAPLIANTICRLYVADQASAKLAASRKAQDWLLTRVGELQETLIENETRLASFNTATELISETALRSLLTQIKQQRSQLAIAKKDRDPDNKLTTTSENSARERIALLHESLKELEDTVSKQGTDLITQRQLEREVETSEEVYAHFLTKYKETAAQEGLQRPDSRVLSMAVVPLSAHSPNRARALAFAVIMSLALATAIVIARDTARRTIRSVEQLRKVNALPVFGCTYVHDGPLYKRLLRRLINRAMIPLESALETRNLRTAFLAHCDAQIISFLTPETAELTQQLAENLARSLTQIGRRVLLVDGQGADNLATGLKDLPVKKQNAGMPDKLALETGEPDLADFLHSHAWRDMLETLRSSYDHILIAAPPVLARSEGLLLAGYSDAALVLVEWDRTECASFKSMLEQLKPANDRLAGCFLMNVSVHGMRRYGLGNETEARYCPLPSE